MAEGFLKSFDKSLEVFSAGTNPSDQVHPKAITVMDEIGINIDHNRPEDVSTYIDQSFDYVITVCDNARETCPVFPGEVKNKLHMGFEDPAEAKGTEEEIISVFRKIRDEIRKDFYDFYLKNIKGSK
jgi:arsenate reductase